MVSGHALLKRGAYRRAIARFKREMASNPLESHSLGAYLAANRGIAEALMRLGRAREARAQLRSSAGERGNPDYWILLAEIELLLANPRQSSRALATARRCLAELVAYGKRHGWPASPVARERLRRIDRLSIARKLRRVRDRSAAELARDVDLPRRSVAALLRQLIELGWVERIGGGPATRYRTTLR